MKIINFFTLLRLEFQRLFRNKVLFLMLFLLPIIILTSVAGIYSYSTNVKVGMYKNDSSIDETALIELIKKNTDYNFEFLSYDNYEKGKEELKYGNITFFVYISKNTAEKNPTAVVYYNGTNLIANTVVIALASESNKHAYETINNFLAKYGIKFDISFFEALTFSSVPIYKLSSIQVMYGLLFGVVLYVIIMLCMAYSVSRDAETNVNYNFAYIPYKISKNYLIKFLVYFALTAVIAAISIIIGIYAFNIKFYFISNIGWVILATGLFIGASIAINSLISLNKSQVSSIIISLIICLFSIVIPLTVDSASCPGFIKVIFNFFPIIPMYNIMNGLIYQNVIMVDKMIYLLIQMIGYSALAIIIQRYQINNRK